MHRVVSRLSSLFTQAQTSLVFRLPTCLIASRVPITKTCTCQSPNCSSLLLLQLRISFQQVEGKITFFYLLYILTLQRYEISDSNLSGGKKWQWWLLYFERKNCTLISSQRTTRNHKLLIKSDRSRKAHVLLYKCMYNNISIIAIHYYNNSNIIRNWIH